MRWLSAVRVRTHRFRSSIMMLANQADQERKRAAELRKSIDRLGEYILNLEQRLRKIEKRAS